MENEGGGDKLKEAAIPGRGKKRPPSPASSPSDDGEDWSMSTSDDDCWEFSEEEHEEEEENDDEEYRDTATSRAKKGKRQAAAVTGSLDNFNEEYKRRTEVMERLTKAWKDANVQDDPSISQVVTKKAHLLFGNDRPSMLWKAVLLLCRDRLKLNVWLASDDKDQRAMLEDILEQGLEGMGTSEMSGHMSRKDMLELVMKWCLEDEEDEAYMLGMYGYALHVDNACSRGPYRNPQFTGEQWVQAKLANPTTSFENQIIPRASHCSTHEDDCQHEESQAKLI